MALFVHLPAWIRVASAFRVPLRINLRVEALNKVEELRVESGS